MRERLVGHGDDALFVRDRGEGPTPVVFVSGLGYSSFCWEETMEALDDGALRLVTLDNRGVGRSAKPIGGYAIERFADDVVRALDALSIDRAHVVGNSMGGYIALTMAVRHPTRVRSLVLANTSSGGDGAIGLPKETADAWVAASKLSAQEFARHTMAIAFPEGWDAAHPERLDALMARRLAFPTPPACWQEQWDACVRFFKAGLDVSTIGCPALVVHGTEDRIIPYANAARLTAQLPRAELVTVEGGGHVPFLENPAWFATLVRSFLGRHRSM